MADTEAKETNAEAKPQTETNTADTNTNETNAEPAQAAPQDKRNFNGTWKLERNDENFDKFWCEMGINFFVRKMMTLSRPTTIINQEGEKFEITNQSMKGTDTHSFTAGEEFDFHNPHTKEVNKLNPFWDGDTLVNKPVEKPDELPTISRHLEGEYLVLTMQKGDVATKRYYKKVVT